MTLRKEQVIDKVEVTENGIVQVRQATRVMEDDVILSQSFVRWCIVPGQDYSDQDEKVVSICAASHTPQVIAEYKAMVDAQKQLP